MKSKKKAGNISSVGETLPGMRKLQLCAVQNKTEQDIWGRNLTDQQNNAYQACWRPWVQVSVQKREQGGDRMKGEREKEERIGGREKSKREEGR